MFDFSLKKNTFYLICFLTGSLWTQKLVASGSFIPSDSSWDVMQLSGGKIIEGKVSKIPPIHTSFGGKIFFDAKELQSIFVFLGKHSEKIQYTLKDGQIFIGDLPKTSFEVEEYFKTYSSPYKLMQFKPIALSLDPKEVEYIQFGKSGAPKKIKLTKKQDLSPLFTLILRQGDRFICSIENETLLLHKSWEDFYLPVRKIKDVRVRSGSLVGFLKAESIDTSLELAKIKEKSLMIRLYKNQQLLNIPWYAIDRILADEGKFLQNQEYIALNSNTDAMVYVPSGKSIIGDHDHILEQTDHDQEPVPDLLFNKPLSKNTLEQVTSFETHTEYFSKEAKKSLSVMHFPSFYIDRYAVTNSDYQKFTLATSHPVPCHWLAEKIPEGLEMHPVVNVSYEDAAAYAAWCGKRLPSEYEWERAAKRENGFTYPYGDEFNPTLSNVHSKGTLPVGSFEKMNEAMQNMPQDMSGNCAEWTSSDYLEKSNHSADEGQEHAKGNQEKKGLKVIKGGSFKSSAATSTCSFRGVMQEKEYNDSTGFRCVKDVEKHSVDYVRGQ